MIINENENEYEIKQINIVNMSYKFYDCLLNSLPDISKWNTINVLDMSDIFA